MGQHHRSCKGDAAVVPPLEMVAVGFLRPFWPFRLTFHRQNWKNLFFLFCFVFFLNSHFLQIWQLSTVPDQIMNVYTPRSVFPNCSIVPSIQRWSPDARQDKKATAEEGRVSCLTRAGLFKSEMELTTHSNIRAQTTETDCPALPCIVLANPSEPCLIK